MCKIWGTLLDYSSLLFKKMSPDPGDLLARASTSQVNKIPWLNYLSEVIP